MTGGTTIDQALISYYDHWPILAERLNYQGEQHPFQGRVQTKWGGIYLDCCTYKNLVRFSEDYKKLVLDYFAFTFVRNPYDLHFSFWQKETKQGRTNEQFSDFRKTRPLQISHLPPTDQLDFIGRTDYFARDIEKLRNFLALDPSIEFTPKNISSPLVEGYRYLDKYCADSIAFVNDAYQADFETLGFEVIDPKNFSASQLSK